MKKFRVFILLLLLTTISFSDVNAKNEQNDNFQPYALCESLPVRRYLSYYADERNNPKETFGEYQMFCNPPGIDGYYRVLKYEYIDQIRLPDEGVRFRYAIYYEFVRR